MKPGLSSATSPAPAGDARAVSVVLVDDHQFILDCLRPVLEKNVPGLKVIGTASDATVAITTCKTLRPNIVVMDIDLPGMGCFEAAATIMAACPETAVMFLSAHSHDEYIEQALRIEARAYVVKRDSLDSLVDAVKTVLAGGVYYSPTVIERLTVEPGGKVSLDRPVSTRLAMLSERERQVLIMLAKGESVKRVALALKLAYKTVDKHKVSLMKKLDIHDRVELCRFAVRERLIEA
jgi:DNA-binding NarL/FixJ family response regulator